MLVGPEVFHGHLSHRPENNIAYCVRYLSSSNITQANCLATLQFLVIIFESPSAVPMVA